MKKKKFTKKKTKGSGLSPLSTHTSLPASPRNRGRTPKQSESQVKVETQRSTVSSSTVYHGPVSNNDSSPWQQDHRPIPAPGGIQDNVVMVGLGGV